jgi:hypothetical protein
LKTIFPKISPISFGMDSTAFCDFIAKIWFFLFFLAAASKSYQLLIVTNGKSSENPNHIQREFLFNNGIHSQNTLAASKLLPEKTNLYKRGVLSLRAADCFAPFPCEAWRPAVTSRGQEGKGWGWGCCHFAPPTPIK